MNIFSRYRHIFKPLVFAIFILITSACSKKQDIVINNGPEVDSGTLNPNATIVYGFSPASGVGNTVVTITGVSFDTNLANNEVYLNDLALPIKSLSSTKIVVVVPVNAHSGSFTVRSGSATFKTTDSFTLTYGYVSTMLTLGAGSIEHLGLDRDNNFYINNSDGVFKISVNGALSPIASGTGFNGIVDFTILANGSIYAADKGNFNIVKISPEKTSSIFAGSSTKGYADGNGTTAKFSAITGIAHDVLGNIYVNDDHRIRKISAAGLVTTLAGNGVAGNIDGQGTSAQFGDLDGIAVDDANGSVYVTDRKYVNIRKITADGTVTTLAGNGIAGFTDGAGKAAQFYDPRTIAVDASGNLWVVDSNSLLPVFTLREINPMGVAITFITGTSKTGVLNGSAYAASVNAPLGLVFDVAGNLYIANTGANIISKVTFK